MNSWAPVSVSVDISGGATADGPNAVMRQRDAPTAEMDSEYGAKLSTYHSYIQIGSYESGDLGTA